MTVAGGDGTDTADLHETGWPAVVSLDGSANDYAEVGGQVPANNFATDIERLIGTSNDDVLTGSSHDDYIDGAGGDDVIDGAAGADDPNRATESSGRRGSPCWIVATAAPRRADSA